MQIFFHFNYDDYSKDPQKETKQDEEGEPEVLPSFTGKCFLMFPRRSSSHPGTKETSRQHF